MARPLLAVEGVSKTFPGLQALQDVAFAVAPGEIVALVGPRGDRHADGAAMTHVRPRECDPSEPAPAAAAGGRLDGRAERREVGGWLER